MGSPNVGVSPRFARGPPSAVGGVPSDGAAPAADHGINLPAAHADCAKRIPRDNPRCPPFRPITPDGSSPAAGIVGPTKRISCPNSFRSPLRERPLAKPAIGPKACPPHEVRPSATPAPSASSVNVGPYNDPDETRDTTPASPPASSPLGSGSAARSRAPVSRLLRVDAVSASEAVCTIFRFVYGIRTVAACPAQPLVLTTASSVCAGCSTRAACAICWWAASRPIFMDRYGRPRTWMF